MIFSIVIRIKNTAMKKIKLITVLLICFSHGIHSQVGIGIPNPDKSAVLELESNQKGFLPPRLTTTERDAIAQPALGLTIFNTTKKCLEWYISTGWYNACGDNGVATIDSVICTTNVAGTMIEGDLVSGVTQTITVDVKTVGSYDISATANGVTFNAMGNFTRLGSQDVLLTATGIPTQFGTHTFALNTSPNSCSFTRETILTVTGKAGKTWMAYNLGATAPATSATDAAQYGDYFQWGRADDGHQKSNSLTQSIQSTTDSPNHNRFITNNSNWRTTPNNNLWQVATGINNPCPLGFRIPTDQEWVDEINASGIKNPATAYSSVLKLTAGGWRQRNSGGFSSTSAAGYYWSTANNKEVRFKTSEVGIRNGIVADGLSVRCIKN